MNWLTEEVGKYSWGRLVALVVLVVIVVVIATLVLDFNGLAPQWLRQFLLFAGLGLWAGFFLLVLVEAVRWLFRDED